MCRNLILVSLKPEGVRLPPIVVESLLNSMRVNSDGFGLWCLKVDGTVTHVRTLSTYEYVRSLVLLNETGASIALLHTHQRAATSGGVNLDNVHLWEKSGLVFSHNGVVSKYASYTGYFTTAGYTAYRANLTGDSDSKKFFEANAERLSKCLKRYNAAAVHSLCEKEGLYGIAMLNSTTTGRFAVVGVNKSIHLYIAEDRSLAVISNTEVFGLTGFKTALCEWVVGQPALPKQPGHLMYKKRRAAEAYYPVKAGSQHPVGTGFRSDEKASSRGDEQAVTEEWKRLKEESEDWLIYWRWGYDWD